MVDRDLGIVLIGDMVDSRRDLRGSSLWLAKLVATLNARYGRQRLAAFEFTQGDELQGLLVATADPFDAVLAAALDEDPWPVRWAIAAGEVEPGRGPATRRTGAVFLAAREAAERGRRERLGLVTRSGDPGADRLLDDVTPVLADLLAELSHRQRSIGRLMLLEGHRQAQVAEALGIARATVSVAYGRGRLASIERLLDASRRLFAAGMAASADPSRRTGAQAGNAAG
jgi:hypothetical protein